MWWQYLLVFLCTILFDIVPLPLPPAFTVIIFLQITYDLEIWPTIFIGVAGSIIGRYVLTLYIPKVSGRIFTRAKNEDVQFLGKRMKKKGWKGQAFILLYSLMPLPTTPLFIAGGMAKLGPLFLIPPFVIGKFLSDTAAVFLGKYVAENTEGIIHGMVSWKSILGTVLGLVMIFALLFVDWRSIFMGKKLKFKFNIWK
jgi:membrane protein YqaA with SNARE-associated domain